MIKLLIECGDIRADDRLLPQMLSDIIEAIGKAGGMGEILDICDEHDEVLWDLDGAQHPALEFLDE